MARDRHPSHHRTSGYESREQKSRNYSRDNGNDYYEANSRYRRERSMSNDRNSYDRDDQRGGSMSRKKDKKSKKSKKSKKEKRPKDYRRRKGDDGYDDMDGSPVSSDPEIEGRDSGAYYKHGSRHTNKSG